MEIKNVLVVHKMGYSPNEKRTVEHVVQVLRKKKILYRIISRLEANHQIVKGRDLIIIIGGDGTFLKTAQFITENIHFLCVNGDPQNTEGFFSKTDKKSFERKLELILKKTVIVPQKKIWRLIAAINGKKIEPCINEYYVGQEKPYDVARYILVYDGKREEQKSSGILICTAAGSCAWCMGAGGKCLQMEQKKFQYVVREPYVGTLIKTTLNNAVFTEKQKITIIAKTEGMIVVPDAVGREYSLPKESYVEITMYKHPIRLYH